MLVLLDKKTGRHIMSQSGNDPKQLDVLYANAKSAGIARKDCEAKVMPAAAFHALLQRQSEEHMGYAEKRAREYPDVRAQLDALWHAMDKGILPKVQGFYDAIAEVKKRHPKGREPHKPKNKS